MLDTNQAKFLTYAIDLESCMHAGQNSGKASEICAALNGLVLDEPSRKTVNDIVLSAIYEIYESSEENIRYVISNLTHVDDRENKLSVLEVMGIIASENAEKADHWLEANVSPDMYDGGANKLQYVRSLIMLCRIAKRYDKMADIRSILLEEAG